MGFFDKILDKFGSSEATRKLLEKHYLRFRKRALRRGNNPYHAHMDAISNLLVGRCSSSFSPYNVNRAKLMSEVYPFLEISEKFFIEYILHLEDDPTADTGVLDITINDIIVDFYDNKRAEIDNETFNEHHEVIKEAINMKIPWTNFLEIDTHIRVSDV